MVVDDEQSPVVELGREDLVEGHVVPADVGSFEDDPAACREPIYMPSASTGSR
jgi:hypothetical protein